ncbi:MAG: hypothetical protein ACK5Z5_06605 [Neisseriaceae bacterium]|jgi:hypothetical protein
MNTFTQQYRSISLVYNNPSIIASLVSKHGDILYISEAMQSLGNNKVIYSNSNKISKNETLEKLNNVVIHNKKNIKYIYVMQTGSTEFTLFNCIKQPVYEKNNNNPVAVLTIQDQFKIINKSSIINKPPRNLHEIEKAILLCINLSLSHGEIYQFIANQYKIISFKKFKTYCDNLLKIFEASTIKELSNNVILDCCTCLLHDELLLIKKFF